MIFHQKKLLYPLILSVTLLSSSLQASGEEALTKSIINLRGDVESLYTDIKENKERYSAQMKSLSMQITDSQAQINRKTTALKLAKSELQKIQTKIKETSSANSDIQPLVLNAIALLETTIKEGFPFMVTRRIDALEKIKSDLKSNLITNEKALLLTWASYDDALRVTKEIGLFKQKIDFKGKKVLAKVAKLGTIGMFFSTPNDEVGYVVKENGKYIYKHITDPEDIKKIVALFDALQKQIRTGFFKLPNALVLQGSN